MRTFTTLYVFLFISVFHVRNYAMEEDTFISKSDEKTIVSQTEKIKNLAHNYHDLMEKSALLDRENITLKKELAETKALNDELEQKLKEAQQLKQQATGYMSAAVAWEGVLAQQQEMNQNHMKKKNEDKKRRLQTICTQEDAINAQKLEIQQLKQPHSVDSSSIHSILDIKHTPLSNTKHNLFVTLGGLIGGFAFYGMLVTCFGIFDDPLIPVGVAGMGAIAGIWTAESIIKGHLVNKPTIAVKKGACLQLKPARSIVANIPNYKPHFYIIKKQNE